MRRGFRVIVMFSVIGLTAIGSLLAIALLVRGEFERKVKAKR